MTKADILTELPKLTSGERRENDAHQTGPSAEEKVLLDEEMADFRANPHDGSPWVEVQARLLRSA